MFADAHGNADATERCIRLLQSRGADTLLFLGDAIGYLGYPRETVELIEDAAAVVLIGNHEAYALGQVSYPAAHEPIYRTQAAVRALGPAALGRMERRLPFYVYPDETGDILCVHGTPWDPLCGRVYPDSNFAAFDHLPFRAVVMAHTHRPFIERSGGTLVINCGSCGLPRDRGDLGACAVIDTETLDAEIVRFGIDAGLAMSDDPDVHESVARLFLRRPGDDRRPPGGLV